MRRILVPAIALAITVPLLAACGSDDDSGTASSPSASSSAATESTTGGPVVDGVPQVSGEVGADPTIAKPVGDPPAELVTKDVVVGDGAEAKAGDTVSVNYKGINWADGSVFDSSFERGEPATFPLPNLIKAWQEGIPGMKVGGRRVIVAPPELAYGAAGSPPNIPPNSTLVFVIDLVGVTPAAS